MISPSSNIYLPQLKETWKIVFGDSDDYIRLFFKYKYRHEETLLYTENGKVRSMLFFPQYELKIRQSPHKIGYICGTATRQEFRGRGFMDKLLERAFSVMSARGCEFAVLIPATKELGDFYAKYGFRPLFKKGVARYVNEPRHKENNSPVSLVRFNDAAKIIRIYNDVVKDRNGVVLQDINTYNAVLKIHRLYGEAYLIRDKNRKDEGYLFCGLEKSADVLIVKEIVAKKDLMARAAQALFRIYGAQKIVFEGMAGGLLPFTKIKDAGMIKTLKNNVGASEPGADYPYMNMMLD